MAVSLEHTPDHLIQNETTDDWLRGIMSDHHGQESTLGSKISRVPKMFRDEKSSDDYDCYTPVVVSIGPYHHNSHYHLSRTEDLKKSLVRQFVKDSGLPIHDLYDQVVRIAPLAKKFYAINREPEKNFEEDKFTRIMFFDGCFILEFMRLFLNKPEALPINSHDAALVKRDMFLVENQLPFFVLKLLMDSSSTFKKDGMKLVHNFILHIRALPPRRESFRDRLLSCVPKCLRDPKDVETRDAPKSCWDGLLQSLFKCLRKITKDVETPEDLGAVHLLDLFRRKFIDKEALEKPKIKEHKKKHEKKKKNKKLIDESRSGGWYRYRPAMELKRVGIEFESRRTGLFTSIQFTPKCLGGKLKLPRLTIDDSTKTLILNLVAYEASLGSSNELGITSYICFMDSLVDNPEDVKELRKKGILFITIGSDLEVATLFNDIANNLVPNPYSYWKVKKEIEKHYKSVVKRWIIHYKKRISGSVLRIITLFTVILGALKAFQQFVIGSKQFPEFCKFQVINAKLTCTTSVHN